MKSSWCRRSDVKIQRRWGRGFGGSEAVRLIFLPDETTIHLKEQGINLWKKKIQYSHTPGPFALSMYEIWSKICLLLEIGSHFRSVFWLSNLDGSCVMCSLLLLWGFSVPPKHSDWIRQGYEEENRICWTNIITEWIQSGRKFWDPSHWKHRSNNASIAADWMLGIY